ncbi:hypothetical protein E3E14_16120 [Streptomyces sp. ICN441]|uniref:hypothetical protein n=1 Tax=Streptomyces sp. ICN441 TaxID=2558286 RepID=UPI00036E1F22|nr:hypothetical protein [Streptomyces sp. ICN441]TFE49387.1 hypothetical protein E3E14_16120 [Streptomyces sp. ICN441]
MHTDGPPDGASRRTRRTRVAEWIVCGVFGMAAALTAVEVLARPSAPWWPFVWQNAWTLSVVVLGCWAVLRVTERGDARAEGRSAAPPGHGPASRDGDEASPPGER